MAFMSGRNGEVLHYLLGNSVVMYTKYYPSDLRVGRGAGGIWEAPFKNLASEQFFHISLPLIVVIFVATCLEEV